MELTRETLAAAHLADTWIEAILSEQPEALLGAANGLAQGPAARAAALAEFRRALITQLAEQPLPMLYADDDDEYEDGDDDDEAFEHER